MEKLFKKKLGITGLFMALLLMSGCTPVVKKGGKRGERAF